MMAVAVVSGDGVAFVGLREGVHHHLADAADDLIRHFGTESPCKKKIRVDRTRITLIPEHLSLTNRDGCCRSEGGGDGLGPLRVRVDAALCLTRRGRLSELLGKGVDPPPKTPEENSWGKDAKYSSYLTR